MNTSPPSAASPFSIRQADLTLDADLIASLWANNLLGHDAAGARAKLALGYRDNPAEGACVQLLMIEGQTQAQGAQGMHARRFWLGQQLLRATGLGDFVVNAAFRSLGPAVALMRRCVQLGHERFDLTYGFPNTKAEPVCTRGGLRCIGQLLRYARPLSSRTYLSRRLPPALVNLTAPLLDLALHAGDGWRALRAPDRLQCRPVDWQDPAFDALWARRPASLLLSERSAAMLQWRYAVPDRGLWQAHLGIDAQGMAQGYVVWHEHAGRALIGDFFAPDAARWTAPLLRAFIRTARAAGMQSISVEFYGAPWIEAQIRQAGLRLRHEPKPVFANANLPAGFDTPGSWYLTGFDNDAD